jgi:hypothetical protein
LVIGAGADPGVAAGAATCFEAGGSAATGIGAAFWRLAYQATIASNTKNTAPAVKGIARRWLFLSSGDGRPALAGSSVRSLSSVDGGMDGNLAVRPRDRGDSRIVWPKPST